MKYNYRCWRGKGIENRQKLQPGLAADQVYFDSQHRFSHFMNNYTMVLLNGLMMATLRAQRNIQTTK
jgi:hypothetical protein